MNKTLKGQVALVAGATRGAGRGIATALGKAGAVVWCTGRSSRKDRERRGGAGQPFDLSLRPETIEETAEIINDAGGQAVARCVDHTDDDAVRALVAEIDAKTGHLDILVNDIWGGDDLAEWGKPMWELSPKKGFAMIDRVLHTHFITTRHAMPLMLRSTKGLVVEITDGDFVGYRSNWFYDLAKMIPIRMALALMADLTSKDRRDVTCVAVTPGFLRSEAMLEHLEVTEDSWRDAVAANPHFVESESPRFVGRAVAALAGDPQRENVSGQVLSSWGLAKRYGFDDLDGRRPDWGSYFDRSIEELLGKSDPLDEEQRSLVRARYFQLVRDPRRLEFTTRMARALGLPKPNPFPS